MSEGRTEQLHHPFVYWAQDAGSLYLKVDLWQVQERSLKVAYGDDGLVLSAIARHAAGHRAYSFELQFYDSIDAQACRHVAQPSHVRLYVSKARPGDWWPRLTKTAARVPWLRVDFDKWRERDDESNVEADDEMGAAGGGGDVDADADSPGRALRKALKLDGGGVSSAARRRRRPSDTAAAGDGDDDSDGQGDAGDAHSRPTVLATAVHHRRLLVKCYLVLYNVFLFAGHAAIFAELAHGFVFEGNSYFAHVWRRVGAKMKYCILAQTLEVGHALVGYTGSNWAASFVQVTGRAFCVFAVVGGDERMHDKPMTFYIFAVYSLIEIFRYPYYTLSVLGYSVTPVTWLRYTMWLPLYPLGFMLEGAILLRAVPYYVESGAFSLRLPNRANVSFDFAYFLLTFMLVAFFPMVWFLFKHMLRQRRKKLFGRARPVAKKLR